jgi:hypothetical protein
MHTKAMSSNYCCRGLCEISALALQAPRPFGVADAAMVAFLWTDLDPAFPVTTGQANGSLRRSSPLGKCSGESRLIKPIAGA